MLNVAQFSKAISLVVQTNKILCKWDFCTVVAIEGKFVKEDSRNVTAFINY